MKKYCIFAAMVACMTHTAMPQTCEANLEFLQTSTFCSTGLNELKARDEIRLEAGFSLNNTSGSTFVIGTDHTIVSQSDDIGVGSIPSCAGRSLDKTLVPGSAGGSVDVGPGGNASYTIPLAIAPGAGGVQPQLAVVYNSSSANGELGWKWHLAGVSKIKKRAANEYHDRYHAGAGNWNKDAFELDGQRLMRDPGNANKYYLENTPSMVFEKNGYTFVGTSPSGVVTTYESSDYVIYYITRVDYPGGMHMEYEYVGDNIGFDVISSIKYAGNGSATAPCEVKFYYSTRADVWSEKQTQPYERILTAIRSFAEGVEASEYHFDYAHDDAYSKLYKVTHSAGDAIYNPTIINWGSSNFSVAGTVNVPDFGGLTDEVNLYYGDVDGDGTTDVVKKYKPQNDVLTRTYINGTPVDFNINENNLVDMTIVDWNGDEKDDMLLHYRSATGDKVVCYSFAGNKWVGNTAYTVEYTPHFASVNGVQTPVPTYYDFYYADLDGDFRTERVVVEYTPEKTVRDEIVWHGKIMGIVDCNNKATTFAFPLEMPNENIGLGESGNQGVDYMQFLDYDGDGASELFVHSSTLNRFMIYKWYKGVGVPFALLFDDQKYNSFKINADYTDIRFGDVDGDGRSDMLYFDKSERKWVLKVSYDDMFVKIELPSDFPNTKPYVHQHIPDIRSSMCFYDINADGKQDIVIAGGTQIKVYLSTGFPWFGGTGSCFKNVFSISIASSDKSVLYIDKFKIFGDGDGDLNAPYIVYGSFADQYFKAYRLAGQMNQHHQVTCISDGNNTLTTLTGAYQRTATNEALVEPLRRVKQAMYVTTGVEVTNATSTVQSKVTYTYYDGLVHPLGRGFMGFRKTRSTRYHIAGGVESTSSSTTTSHMWMSCGGESVVFVYPATSSVVRGGLSSSSNTQMSATPVAGTGNRLFAITSVSKNETDADGVSRASTSFYDAATGLPTGVHTGVINKSYTYYNPVVTTVNNHDVSISRLKTSTVMQTLVNAVGFSEETAYTYDEAVPTRVVKTTVTNKLGKASAAASRETSFSQFDKYGNPQAVTTTTYACGRSTTLTTGYEYDPTGRFVTATTSPEGYRSTATHRPTDGALLSATDHNGLTTTCQYGAGGGAAQVTTMSPGGLSSTTTLGWSTDAGLYYKSTSASDGSYSVVYHDGMGNPLKTSSRGLMGALITTTSTYNGDGTLASTTDAAGVQTTYAYTDGRLQSATTSGITSSYQYSYLKTEVTNSATGITTATTTDILGNPRLVETLAGAASRGKVEYVYYDHGKLQNVKVNGLLSNEMTYDLASLQQLSLTDPDAGTTTYTYNGLGQLLEQTDARGKKTSCTYNEHGRLQAKITDVAETYQYSEVPGSIGKVKSITRGDTKQEYTYDGLGRITSSTTSVPKRSGAAPSTYTTAYTYNTRGLVATSTLPTGVNLQHEYDAAGNHYMTKNTASGMVYWEGKTADARGRWTGSSINNGSFSINKNFHPTFHGLTSINAYKSYRGSTTSFAIHKYSYNEKGQMSSREDPLLGLVEYFKYDDLNRLTEAAPVLNNVKQTHHFFNYEANGNIKNTSMAGTYAYLTTKPHAVKSVSGLVSNTKPENTTGWTSASSTTSTSFNASNMVDTISTPGRGKLLLFYGPGGGRVRMESYNAAGAYTGSKLYVGGCEYGFDASGNQAYARAMVGSPAGTVTVVETRGTTTTTHTVVTDFQGSWTTIIDAQGTIVKRQAFDAWGRARDPFTWKLMPISTGSTAATLASLAAQQPMFDRGYTGHEHLCAHGLINMNGRLYDPQLQRFLSPDPYVQQPGNSQSYNRYSYCLNNPLKYTDPSGYWFGIDDLIAAAIGGVVNLTVNAFQGNIHSLGDGLAAFGAGAVAGDLALYGPAGWAAGGAIVGGTNAYLGGARGGDILQGAVIGTFSGLAGGAVGSMAANACSPLLSSISSPVLRGAATGLVGGAAGGYAGGFTAGFMMTGDLGQANSAGLSGMAMGAGIGGAVGAGYGFKYASDNNLNPWNGKPNAVETPYQTPQAKGQQGVNRAEQEVVAQGGKVVAREVTLEVNGVRVRVDIAADFNGEITLIEVKNGPSAGFTPNQKIVYPQMRDGIPIIPRGANAVPVWGPGQVGQPTIMYQLIIKRY